MLQQRDFSFIYKYFTAEKQESLLFLVVGIAAILLAVLFWFFIKTNPSFFKGAAIPLLAIGLIQSVVGFTVYTRTDKQKTDIAYNIGIEPALYIKQTELPRMQTVLKNFIVYRYAEIALALIGFGLFLYFKNNEALQFCKGFGLTLAIMALLTLAADYFAEQRGHVYVKGLMEFTKSGT
jgi:hypothetical protein